MSYFTNYKFDKKIRLGSKSDGGYVIGELEDEIYDCYISAGISNEDSFSRDFINKYSKNDSLKSYGFDGTINEYPKEYYTQHSKLTYIKKNINSFNDSLNTNLEFLFNEYSNIFLKMDIEGYEYPWILSLDTINLKKCKQIVIEFHGIHDNTWNTSHSDKIKCFKKLEETHYIIHSHGNNYSNLTNMVPDVIELTYINKEYFKNIPELNYTEYPIEGLDYPNCPQRADYKISSYPFISRTMSHEKIFTDIYSNCKWGNNNNIHYNGSSGFGSSLEYNLLYIRFIKQFIKKKAIQSVVDLGCGDFLIGKYIYDDLNIKYTGYDTYSKIINYHQTEYSSNDKYKFIHLDFYNKPEEIIPADLYILKDVIQHWTNQEIYKFMDYLVNTKRYKYILLINDYKVSNELKESWMSRKISYDTEPLSKYSPSKLYEYNDKQINLITLT